MTVGIASPTSETLCESAQQRLLFLPEEDRRFCGVKPCAAVDLRNHYELLRTWRPFHFTGVAAKFRRVTVAFKSPSRYKLSALLLNRSKLNERLGSGEPGFLLKFTDSCRQGVFVGLILPFRERP